MIKFLITILLILIPSISHADITSNLAAHWKFNEGSGTSAADATGNLHTGTLNGDAAWRSPSKIGAYAIAYSGTSGGGTSFSTITAGTTWTYAAWIYIPSGTVNTFANLMANSNAIGLWMVADKIRYDGGGGGVINSTTSITRDTWHHIAVVDNATAVTFYLDGSADGTGTVTTSQFFNGMGCDSGTGAECFKGYHDDVRYYTRALSSGDISTLYAYTDPDITTGLVARWDFEEGSGTTAIDYSGNGNNGTLTGGGVTYSAGKIGTFATSYNGSSYVVKVANPISAYPFTISAWFKAPSSGGGSFISYANTASNVIYYDMHVAGVVPNQVISSNLRSSAPDETSFNGSTTLTSGTWYFGTLVITSATDHKLYLNGVQEGTDTVSIPFVAGDNIATGVTNRSSQFGFWPSDVDDARYYTRALNATDINTLYNFTDPSSANTSGFFLLMQ